MQASPRKCKVCGLEFMYEEEITRHKVKAHGDVNAVQYLSCENKGEMQRKVIVRNLYLSGIPQDIIALQIDLDVPTVVKIIEEIKREWLK